MQTSKKVLLSSVSFILIITLISSVFIVIFLKSDFNNYQDIKLRDSLEGTINTLIVGSCQGKYGFDSNVIDNKLACNSYNLCGIHTSPIGEQAILLEEIDRNPVHTVIIDINYDTLSYSTKGINALGDLTLIPRLKNSTTRTEYFFKNVHIEDYPIVYYNFLSAGIKIAKEKINGSYKSQVINKNKGHLALSATDFTIPKEEIVSKYQSQSLITDINEQNDKKLNDLIQMCKKRDIDVILVMTPSSDNYVWSNSGWNKINQNVSKIANQNNVEFWDFNLFISKSNILSDKNSYQGLWHLSDNGSVAFSLSLCEIINKYKNGIDVSNLFYSSYDEAIKHMDYYKKYQELTKEQ